MVKGENMLPEHLDEYAALDERASPDWIEVKGYVHVGHSRENLTIDNMPSHEEILDFSKALAERLGLKVLDDSPPSRVALIGKEKIPLPIPEATMRFPADLGIAAGPEVADGVIRHRCSQADGVRAGRSTPPVHRGWRRCRSSHQAPSGGPPEGLSSAPHRFARMPSPVQPERLDPGASSVDVPSGPQRSPLESYRRGSSTCSHRRRRT